MNIYTLRSKIEVMIYWQKAPFFRPALVAISGLSLALFFRYELNLLYIAGFSFLILSLLLIYNPLKTYTLQGFILVFAISSLFFYRGSEILSVQDEPWPQGNIFIRGKVSEIWNKDNHRKLVLEDVYGNKNLDSLKRLPGKLLVYLSVEDSIHYPLDAVLIFKGDITKPEGNGNPRAFDYRNYLYKKGIYAQSFRPENIHIIKSYAGFGFRSWLNGFRSDLEERFRRLIPDEKQRGIVLAMVLGIRDQLDPTIQDSFRGTGAMHVLAVSGLHVGIVASLLGFLLRFFSLGKKSPKVIRFILVVTGVWGYVLLAGASASVVRAGLMFSLLTFDYYYYGNRNSVNLLAATCIIMLIVNPLWLWDIGFQFSFLAVLGILLIYPVLKRLFPHYSTPLFKYILSLVLVSICAQLALAPLSIYYFHQFPLYFIFSSLIAIPLAFLIVSIGVITVMLSFITWEGAQFIGDLLAVIIEGLNNGILWISEWPKHLLTAISWNEVHLILGYGMIIFGVFYLHYRCQRSFRIFLVITTCMFIYMKYLQVKATHNSELVIYAVNKGSLLEYYNQKSAYTIQEGLEEKDIHYAAAGKRRENQIEQYNDLSTFQPFLDDKVFYREGIIVTSGKILAKANLLLHNNYAGPVHYLWVSREFPRGIKDLVMRYKPEVVVLDRSIKYKSKINFKKELEDIQQNYHDIREKGAFTLKF